jgi:chorismate mutase
LATTCVRGIRGAVQAAENQPEAILSATRELLAAIQAANPDLQPGDIASILFTVTSDLDAAFPAQAARQPGWQSVPLMCAWEIPVPGSLPRVVRILVHWNTSLAQDQVRHVYLGEAARLRPDIPLTG